MKLRNNEEFTMAGKVAVGVALLVGAGVLGGIVASAPPSEIESARQASELRKAEKERTNQETIVREYSRRLNGG